MDSWWLVRTKSDSTCPRLEVKIQTSEHKSKLLHALRAQKDTADRWIL